jgi:hypothetical protein
LKTATVCASQRPRRAVAIPGAFKAPAISHKDLALPALPNGWRDGAGERIGIRLRTSVHDPAGLAEARISEARATGFGCLKCGFGALADNLALRSARAAHTWSIGDGEVSRSRFQGSANRSAHRQGRTLLVIGTTTFLSSATA